MSAFASFVSQNLLDQTDHVHFLLQSDKGSLSHNFITEAARIEQLKRKNVTDVEIARMMVMEAIGEVENITLCEDTEEVLDLSREYYEMAKSCRNVQVFGYNRKTGRYLW